MGNDTKPNDIVPCRMDGRDAKGRVTKGHSLPNKSNGLDRRYAAWRKALARAVTPEQLQKASERCLAIACRDCEGDATLERNSLLAYKTLLEFTVVKPTQHIELAGNVGVSPEDALAKLNILLVARDAKIEVGTGDK